MFFKFWKSLSWTVLILYLTLSSGTGLGKVKVFAHADKLVHFFLFFAFSLIFSFDWHNFQKGRKSVINTNIVVFVSALILGAGTELAQYFFIESRHGGFLDMTANLAGAGAGLVVATLLVAKYK